MENPSLTTPELLHQLGERLRTYRIQENITQQDVAIKAGVAERTVRALERGRGTVETLVRVIRALNAPDPLSQLVPKPQISPMALLRTPQGPKRASRRRRPA